MKNYFVKKLLQIIVMMFLISLIAFAVIYAAPGDISAMYVTPDMTAEQVEALREHLGLNKSLPEQYIAWLSSALQGDLGVSLANKSPVVPQILKRLPATLELMGLSLFVAVVVSVPLGLISGYKKDTWVDRVISGFTYLGMSVPSFWMGMLLIVVFALKLSLFPTSGMHTVGAVSLADTLWHMVLPCITLSLPMVSVYTRYIKSGTIRELSEEYVMTAKAKGTDGYKILWKHVLKNTLLPVITLLGMNLATLVSGSFIVESVFGWPGVGTLAMNAIKAKDYPVIMAYILLAGMIVIIGNFLADILYGIADPRIKKETDHIDGK